MFKPLDPKPDFSKLEEEILKFWEDNKIFEKSLDQTKAGQPYTFYDGPPFATGTPHYGHILASTVKDLFPRYQTMQSRFVRRRWGWDCHGLPIEEIVERKLGISGKKDIEKLGIKKFNEICRSMVLEYVGEWRKTIRRIARWVDFDNSYKTMDRDYMESVWWAFKQIYDKGLIYEGRRVLLYCPRCETPISNFEVAMDNSYKEVTEEAVTVKFKLKGEGGRGNGNTYLLAWTTTPWTIPGNVALAVGEDIDYVKVEIEGEGGRGKGEVYILAKDRLEILHATRYTLHATIKGKDLVGLEYEPLFDVPKIRGKGEGGRETEYRVYAADFVNTEEGTGIVHTAVVYGEDDYNLGLKVGLPVVPLLDEKGKFNGKAPKLIQGMYFKDSEKIIKKDLESRGLLFAKNQHQHSYPHCWRCGTTLFYNAIPAWFMNIQKIKPGLLETNEKQMNWYPDHLKHGRYQKSVEAAPDWNISRNRYWGNPIPVWKCDDKDCGEITVVGSIKELGLARNTFYFTRHAEARNNVELVNSCYPETGTYDLTKLGIKEAEVEARKLKNLGGIDLIVTSDLTRTKHTAEIIGKLLNVPVEFDPRLHEFNVGADFNGKSYSEFNKLYPFENRWEKSSKDGEGNLDVQKRMLKCVRDINEKHQGKRILIVGHGDPLWLLMNYFGSERPYPDYAGVFEMDISIVDLHRPYIDEVVLTCKKCAGPAHRISEIFDSWVEAGSMPFAEYHYPFDQKEVFESRNPGQFVAEYIGQTRAWFYVCHVMGFNLFGRAPFENVVTTGTIQAEDGQKMSKSKNNFPDPWKVIGLYGVDALRFYLMNSPVMQAENLNFSERDLAITYRKNVLILWNVFNYFVTYANEANYEPDLKFNIDNLKFILDQWILAKTQELVNGVTDQLDGYNTVRATRAIEDYINELSTWYLRRSRGRKDDDFFATLRHCLLKLSKVIAPIMPYMAELIYQNLNCKQAAPSGRASPIEDGREVQSVHLAKWPEKQELAKEQTEVLARMIETRQIVEAGHRDRSTNNIKLRQPLSSLIYATLNDQPLGTAYEQIIADEVNVKEVKFAKGFGAFNVSFDYTITAKLKKEGLARELERAVQEMRKKAGFKVGEKVNLSYDTSDEELKAAFELIDTKKTYIKGIKREKGAKGEEVEIDGKKFEIRISKS